MGIIKRALRRTSRKLLAKLIPPAHSQQLVLNPPMQSAADSLHADHLSKRKLASLKKRFRKSNGKDTAVAEALLLAAMNHLPPLQFHHVHGPHAQLSQNKCVARRTQSFCQALVFSNRVILPNERVYIKVLEISKCWSGTIRFGFTAVDPATLACRMPKHACPDMTNAGHTWARALADDVVRRKSVIHFSYNNNGIIHYGINNQDCGVFHANVNTSQNLWFIVDIYGLTAAVELIDPRVNRATSGMNFSAHHDDDEDEHSTVYKSTSAMDELFGRYRTSSARRKKISRKSARRTAAILQAAHNWPLDTHPRAIRDMSSGRWELNHHQDALRLPNLNSISLPGAQQNIYSPMPSLIAAATTQRVDSHDYQQIISNTYAANDFYQPIGRPTELTNSISMANIRRPQASSSSASNSFSSNVNNSTSLISNSHDETSASQLDLSHQLENMRLHDRRATRVRQQQAAATKIAKSSASASSQAPVAATRRRQQARTSGEPAKDQRDSSAAHRIVSTKSTLSSPTSSSHSSSAPATRKAASSSSGADGTVKPKTRHSIKNAKSISTARDNNDNNGPPSKADCPICFERPINCVLYQCGHMCTCYECGVRQWKTGSRTCPICRAIIKDVIKTYKS